MPGSLIPIGKLKERLIKLLRKKYESPNQLSSQNKRRVLKINQKIQLMKATCERKLMDMAEINNIMNNWKLMSCGNECKENTIAEPIDLEEAMEDSLGEC
jgi:hypothetical protein